MSDIFRKAQSVIEYTVLIITITAAFIAMSLYLQRAANQRLRDVEQEANPGIYINEGG